MSASLALTALALTTVFFTVPSEAHGEGGQIIDRATGTSFDGMTQVEAQSFKCVGAGVRKLLLANVYAVAFYVEVARADALVEGYIQDHHAGLRGDALFEALRKDPKFFRMLASAKANRLAVLKMRRDLSQRQLTDNIRRSLRNLLSDEKLDKLTGAITAGAKKGQIVKIYALGNRLTVDVAGELRVINDEEVTRKLFLVWLGSKSVSPTLREDVARRAAQLSDL